LQKTSNFFINILDNSTLPIVYLEVSCYNDNDLSLSEKGKTISHFSSDTAMEMPFNFGGILCNTKDSQSLPF